MPTFDVETQQGLKAYELATTHAAVLDPRLPSGHRAALAQTLGVLGAAIPGQVSAREESKTATLSQFEKVTSVITLLGGFREAVKHDSAATAKDRKDFGVGVRLDASTPKRVLAAGAVVVKNAKVNPQRAIALGITPDDVALLERSLAEAKTADDAQDVRRARAPNATKERNAARKKLVEAIRKIGGVGMLAFATNATIRAEFEALLSGPSKR